ncbi:hypothetical protein [Chryseobacterium sp.]|uniref:hypothetical protein n=1 Tax=Chryseobacterium sp. TaxID=1871047 RepID=UPI0031E1321C
MENTLENKAKFFAQYWGQRVCKETLNDKYYLVKPSIYPDADFELEYLELKPLSSITDEDALNIAKSYYMATEKFQTIKSGRQMVDCHLNQITLELPQVDYLRSKGYALPWMGLSVEKLVEYGWIELK